LKIHASVSAWAWPGLQNQGLRVRLPTPVPVNSAVVRVVRVPPPAPKQQKEEVMGTLRYRVISLDQPFVEASLII
jgi:hypothetical protein